jgi:peptidoglycan LD-endopeptidase LytH
MTPRHLGKGRSVVVGHLGITALLLAGCSVGQRSTPSSTTQAASMATSTSSLPEQTTTTEAATTTTTISLQERILAAPSDDIARAYPISADVTSSYARIHSGYPAADVFAVCGAEVHAMVTGVVVHIRAVDTYDRKTDNPALRGGKSVAVLGGDAVRYYTSHLDRIDVTVGQAVVAGDVVGTIGLTGDSEACHTHVGLSPLCAATEWSIRRGVIWPWPYLDAWKAGKVKAPGPEIRMWSAAHADACTKASGDPNAGD